MNLELTWDLVILLFFLLIGTYSFMIGGHRTMKVIIGGYMAILLSDALGNILQMYVIGKSSLVVQTLSVYAGLLGIQELGSDGATTLILVKIMLFIIFMVFLTIKAPFEADIPKTSNTFGDFLVHLFYSFLSGIFIVTTFLRILAGDSLLSVGPNVAGSNLLEIAKGSFIMALIVKNYEVWFLIPGIFVMMANLIPTGGGDEE